MDLLKLYEKKTCVLKLLPIALLILSSLTAVEGGITIGGGVALEGASVVLNHQHRGSGVTSVVRPNFHGSLPPLIQDLCSSGKCHASKTKPGMTSRQQSTNHAVFQQQMPQAFKSLRAVSAAERVFLAETEFNVGLQQICENIVSEAKSSNDGWPWADVRWEHSQLYHVFVEWCQNIRPDTAHYYSVGDVDQLFTRLIAELYVRQPNHDKISPDTVFSLAETAEIGRFIFLTISNFVAPYELGLMNPAKSAYPFEMELFLEAFFAARKSAKRRHDADSLLLFGQVLGQGETQISFGQLVSFLYGRCVTEDIGGSMLYYAGYDRPPEVWQDLIKTLPKC